METCSYVNYFSYMSNAGVKAVKKLPEEKEVNTSMIWLTRQWMQWSGMC